MKMKSDDFWFAVNNTEVVVMPTSHLETFGTTNLYYHMVSELMDTVNQIRIREGTIKSQRPQVIAPTIYANEILEGFGEEAHRYTEWLQTHAKDLRILQYGYKVQKTELNEHIVTGTVNEVLERVKKQVEQKKDSLAAVIRGVDEPWDVCLLKFMFDVIRHSVPFNVNEMGQRGLFDDVNGVPRAIRDDIEKGFLQASRAPSKINQLMAKLRRYSLFDEYEDRFFALVRQKAKRSTK